MCNPLTTHSRHLIKCKFLRKQGPRPGLLSASPLGRGQGHGAETVWHLPCPTVKGRLAVSYRNLGIEILTLTNLHGGQRLLERKVSNNSMKLHREFQIALENTLVQGTPLGGPWRAPLRTEERGDAPSPWSSR